MKTALFLLRKGLALLLPLAVVYHLCLWKNRHLDLDEATFWQWLRGLFSGQFYSGGSTDNLKRDLMEGTFHSAWIVAAIMGLTLVLTIGLGWAWFAYEKRAAVRPWLIALCGCVALLPPFLVYDLLVYHDWAQSWSLRDGLSETFSQNIFLSLLVFALFNSFFFGNAASLAETWKQLFQQPFVKSYRALGASGWQLARLTTLNWFWPLAVLFAYSLPFAMVESIVFEFMFQINGLGTLFWEAYHYDEERQALRIFTPRLMTLTTMFALVSVVCNSTVERLQGHLVSR